MPDEPITEEQRWDVRQEWIRELRRRLGFEGDPNVRRRLQEQLRAQEQRVQEELNELFEAEEQSRENDRQVQNDIVGFQQVRATEQLLRTTAGQPLG